MPIADCDPREYFLQDRIDKLSEKFIQYDTDCDGVINESEMLTMFKKLGKHYTKQQIRDVIKEVDVDCNGAVDFEEMCVMVIKLNRLRPRADLIDHTNYLDEKAIANLIAKYKLTGQYAFDYFREDSTGKFFVIECNPRASSVLEGVSGTPGWGASFFGDDVRAATQYQKVGFWFHQNCWPFVADRCEGFWSWFDPLPLFVAQFSWPLEMLRIKGALRGGPLSRSPTGIPIEAGTPLTAAFPTLFEALGLNYHHLDVNIGKVIVPGPTVGRDYAYFEEIARDTRASFLRAQVRERGARPSVLCANAEVARALAGMDGCAPKVTRLVQDPMEMMQAARENHDVKESLVLGSPRSTLRNLAQQQRSFDAIFLSEELLAEVPQSLVVPGGRVLPLETLPPAAGKL